MASRAPVDRRALALDESSLPELEEDPLAPTVVVHVAALDRAVPVVGKTHAPERRRLLVDVRVRPLGRMRVALDRGILGRKAERVPPDRVQHLEAGHGGLPGDHVTDGVVAHVAHVDVTRRVREHLKDVLLGLGGVLGRVVEPLALPLGLPLLFDAVRFVDGLAQGWCLQDGVLGRR